MTNDAQRATIPGKRWVTVWRKVSQKSFSGWFPTFTAAIICWLVRLAVLLTRPGSAKRRQASMKLRYCPQPKVVAARPRNVSPFAGKQMGRRVAENGNGRSVMSMATSAAVVLAGNPGQRMAQRRSNDGHVNSLQVFKELSHEMDSAVDDMFGQFKS